MKKLYYLFLIPLLALVISGCMPKTTNRPDNNTNNSVNSVVSDDQDDNDGNEDGRVIDLSNQGLTTFPMNILDDDDLMELDISRNRLTGAMPAEIRQLEDLRVLDASDNQMTGVPAEIGQLSKLEILDLSNNQLTGLPYELGNLQNLKTLNISGNNYSQADLAIIEDKLPDSVNIIK